MGKTNEASALPNLRSAPKNSPMHGPLLPLQNLETLDFRLLATLKELVGKSWKRMFFTRDLMVGLSYTPKMFTVACCGSSNSNVWLALEKARARPRCAD